MAEALGARELARLVRRSHTLDPLLKRRWLVMLPHLSAADRVRLAEILRAAEGPGTGAGPAAQAARGTR